MRGGVPFGSSVVRNSKKRSRSRELQSSSARGMPGAVAEGRARSCRHPRVGAAPKPRDGRSSSRSFGALPNPEHSSSGGGEKRGGMVGGGGCGVGLRGRAEQCGKSSERIQSERRLRAGEGGGGLQGGAVLCFVFTDLSSGLRWSVRSLSAMQAMLNLPVPQSSSSGCCAVPRLRVGLLGVGAGGQRSALCSSSPSAVCYKCTYRLCSWLVGV